MTEPNDDPIDVLLVEDNPNDAEFSLRALRKSVPSQRIAHVADGAQALDFLFATGAWAARATSRPPKVVLLDLKLPKVDGLEVLRRLKGDPRTRSLPVVVLTSSKEPRDVREAYDNGVNSFVVKPVNFDAFTAALADLARYWVQVNQPGDPGSL